MAASPSSTARLTSVPARSTVTCRPPGASNVAGCSNSGAACSTPGIASTFASRVSSKPAPSCARSCRSACPMTALHHLARGAGDAALRDGCSEDQRDRDRDADAGQQLRDRVRAQPPPVDIEQRVADVAFVCGVYLCLSRHRHRRVEQLSVTQRVATRSASRAASASWVTSTTAAFCSCARPASSPTVSRLRAVSRLPVGSSARISLAHP